MIGKTMIIILLACLFTSLIHAHEIGTAIYQLTDHSRIETHVPGTQSRELVIQIWYPAQPSNNQSYVSYLGKTSSIIKKNMSAGWATSEENFDYLDDMLSHSVANAPISNQCTLYPLLIFSPGFGTPYQLYTNYFETLARQNYIVVALSHTYNTNPTFFPDGRIIEQCESFKNAQSDVLHDELETWVADIRFVIDQMGIYNTNEDHLLSGKIDMHNIGIFGHSFGGAAAMRVCQLDQRMRACVNMDGKLWGNTLEQTITIPLMTLLSDAEINPHAKETDRCAFQLMSHAQNDTYCFMISGAHHYSFSDDTILTNYQYCTQDGKALVSFLPFLISSFFDTYLHHQDNQVLGALAQHQHMVKRSFIDIGKGFDFI